MCACWRDDEDISVALRTVLEKVICVGVNDVTFQEKDQLDLLQNVVSYCYSLGVNVMFKEKVLLVLDGAGRDGG